MLFLKFRIIKTNCGKKTAGRVKKTGSGVKVIVPLLAGRRAAFTSRAKYLLRLCSENCRKDHISQVFMLNCARIIA